LPSPFAKGAGVDPICGQSANRRRAKIPIKFDRLGALWRLKEQFVERSASLRLTISSKPGLLLDWQIGGLNGGAFRRAHRDARVVL
jgi:hypothetical protein